MEKAGHNRLFCWDVGVSRLERSNSSKLLESLNAVVILSGAVAILTFYGKMLFRHAVVLRLRLPADAVRQAHDAGFDITIPIEA